MEEKDGAKTKERWRRSPDLKEEIFQIWQKPGGVLNPSSIIATIESEGAPHVAPFGSLHALNPRLLRVVIHRYHDTLANIMRDGRVAVALACPPDIAVSVKGIARVVEERWSFDEKYAIVEIDIVEVKNDMPRGISMETGITISATGPFQEWWKSCWEELQKT